MKKKNYIYVVVGESCVLRQLSVCDDDNDPHDVTYVCTNYFCCAQCFIKTEDIKYDD